MHLRLTAGDGAKLKGDFSRDPAGVELYAHAGDSEEDFDMYENENIADSAPDLVTECIAIAKKQWSKSKSKK